MLPRNSLVWVAVGQGWTQAGACTSVRTFDTSVSCTTTAGASGLRRSRPIKLCTGGRTVLSSLSKGGDPGAKLAHSQSAALCWHSRRFLPLRGLPQTTCTRTLKIEFPKGQGPRASPERQPNRTVIFRLFGSHFHLKLSLALFFSVTSSHIINEIELSARVWARVEGSCPRVPGGPSLQQWWAGSRGEIAAAFRAFFLITWLASQNLCLRGKGASCSIGDAVHASNTSSTRHAGSKNLQG